MIDKIKKFEDTIIPMESSIFDALKIIDDTALQIALVADKDRKLVGTVTDGDIRRAILAGIKLEESVTKIMKTEFTAIGPQKTDEEALRLMIEKKIHRLPVVDEHGHIVGLKQIGSLIGQGDVKSSKTAIHHDCDPAKTWVVLMLGGLGERLRPLTEDIPKPMIAVGDKPLLETILDNFKAQGFRKFFFSVNYKADVIEAHFKDGKDLGVDITYLHEENRMGTAGALGLLPERPEQPFIVMNGDILTNNSFAHLLNFHTQNHAAATMCVREYQYQVPYGIVQTVGTKLDSIVEKPSHSYFVNAGIYVLSPEILPFISGGEYLDMPHLFEKLGEQDYESAVFPIREYWVDVGNMEDLEQARRDYDKIFKG